jgi:hypothetical protein
MINSSNDVLITMNEIKQLYNCSEDEIATIHSLFQLKHNNFRFVLVTTKNKMDEKNKLIPCKLTNQYELKNITSPKIITTFTLGPYYKKNSENDQYSTFVLRLNLVSFFGYFKYNCYPKQSTIPPFEENIELKLLNLVEFMDNLFEELHITKYWIKNLNKAYSILTSFSNLSKQVNNIINIRTYSLFRECIELSFIPIMFRILQIKVKENKITEQTLYQIILDIKNISYCIDRRPF